MTDYNVRLVRDDEFNVSVNYEAPLKSVQYNNLILDDISSLFDGTATIFPLTVNGSAYFPINEQQLIISINDIMLNPGVDFQVSGSNINFTSPPTDTDYFFGIALQTVADITRTIAFNIDNGSQVIPPGSKGFLTLDISGTLESWTVLSDDTGSIAIDIQKTTYNQFPDGFSSIVGSEFPLLLNRNKNRDDDLTTWNKEITIGDVLNFRVLSCTGITKCSIFLRLKI
jgi:hypothetical protein